MKISCAALSFFQHIHYETLCNETIKKLFSITFLHEKNAFAEESKILLDINLKIILLDQ